ncbi:hypothetical protein [Streptomyces sp. NPDC097619]|uniref:hypothetical protein n=1 Tax=Streptomyces sp. NPDC097619 TaxID=3157228 RepID=UPI00331AD449
MAQHTLARGRVCPDCDGFPVVHITTGTTAPGGGRNTLAATCPACHGTGTRSTRTTTAGVSA